ncbi:MAG: 3'-5' exonuclease, partial [Desulforhopalus sp.]
ACSLLLSSLSSPEKLLASVSLALGRQGRVEPGAGPFDEAVTCFDAARARLSSWWQAHQADLCGFFKNGLEGGYFKKNFAANFDKWFSSIDDFLSGKTAIVPESLELLDRQHLAEQLNGNRLRGLEKRQAFLRDWPLGDGVAADFLSAADAMLLALRVNLAHELRGEVGRRLESKGQMGFDDLVHRLANGVLGERGQLLRHVLGERFAMALIDEFQDTDSAQWSIFSTLFCTRKHYLYLIGDPKQAIYKFRGADIYSYFQARETAASHLTLAKNYRSHPFLVDEINRLFSSRPDPFRFGGGALDYRPVTSARTKDDLGLFRADDNFAGMVYCHLLPPADTAGGRWTSGKAGDAIRSFVASEVGRLLDPRHAVFVDTGDRRPLSPADIGILVRSNRQAREYRQALVEKAIPAVIGSNQSVFVTAQCRELMYVAEAISSPGDMVKLKTALAVPWFGFTGSSLQSLWEDEEQVSLYHSRFLGYNELWRDQGFLVMMSRILAAEEVLLNLAPFRGAERAIANIFQLLELIQGQEHEENLGSDQLLQWLKKMMQEEGGGAEAELLLESDENAVRIVTMHSAKGLEYPVVFCPYLWYAGQRVQQEKLQVSCHEPGLGRIVDLGSDQFIRRRQLATEEERAEDMRLLYVAMTRAKLRCYTFWCDARSAGVVGDSFDSALGYLLFPAGPCDSQTQHDTFASLAEKSPVTLLTVAADETSADFAGTVTPQEFHCLPPSGRSLYTDWQMSSFSAMAHFSDYGYEMVRELLQNGQGAVIPVTGLPAGPNFGNVVHDLLESFSFKAVATLLDEDARLDQVRQKCRRYGASAEPEEVARLLKLVVETPLKSGAHADHDNFSLSMLADGDCLKEMAFYYRLSHLATDRVNTILAKEKTVAPLSHKEMQGYLTGFVDLICRYRDRYYVIDYKTNFLGEQLEDYSRENLVSAMKSHNYGLQYWIYSLVLHRHLKNFLPGYAYQQNYGGVMYLFVRGMRPDIAGGGVYSTTPDYHTLRELERVIGGGEQ